jgi:hypothetical protein
MISDSINILVIGLHDLDKRDVGKQQLIKFLITVVISFSLV